MKLTAKAPALAALASVAALLPAAFAAESPDSDVLTLGQSSFKTQVDDQVRAPSPPPPPLC